MIESTNKNIKKMIPFIFLLSIIGTNCYPGKNTKITEDFNDESLLARFTRLLCPSKCRVSPSIKQLQSSEQDLYNEKHDPLSSHPNPCKANLQALPTELIYLICMGLPPRQILCLSLSNQFFNEILNDDFWGYYVNYHKYEKVIAVVPKMKIAFAHMWLKEGTSRKDIKTIKRAADIGLPSALKEYQKINEENGKQQSEYKHHSRLLQKDYKSHNYYDPRGSESNFYSFHPIFFTVMEHS